MTVRKFDEMIGRLDRLLSEFMIAAEAPALDQADRQTLKHHADDLIGVGTAVRDKIKKPKKRRTRAEIIRCQFCHETTPAAEWRKDKCPKCGRLYDAELAQDGDDE